MFMPPYRGGGSSAIYSCKINVKESDGTLWLHVFASHLRGFALRSGAHSVKWNKKCVKIQNMSAFPNNKFTGEKKQCFCMLEHFYLRTRKVGQASC